MVRQNPPAGTLLAQGGHGHRSSCPAAASQVQNVVGDPKATAVSILRNQGFQVQVITVAGAADATPGQRVPAEPGGGQQPRRPGTHR